METKRPGRPGGRAAIICAALVIVAACTLLYLFEFSRESYRHELRIFTSPVDTHYAENGASLPLPPKTAYVDSYFDGTATYFSRYNGEQFLEYYAQLGYDIVGRAVLADGAVFEVRSTASPRRGANYVSIAPGGGLDMLLDRIGRHYESSGVPAEPATAAFPVGGRVAVYEEVFCGIPGFDSYIGERYAGVPVVRYGQQTSYTLYRVAGETSAQYLIRSSPGGILTLWRFREIVTRPTDELLEAFPEASFAPLGEGEEAMIIYGGEGQE